ncbi:MAG: mechanosensitive ion channel family protein [Sedimentisphaerales bacterium]|nr:mechanosensitive ion channel family protein [Sedimentisphaerales bacterium]
MIKLAFPHLLASVKQLQDIVNYEIVGNELWRFGLLLLVILATLIVGRFVRFIIDRTAQRLERKDDIQLLQSFLCCVSRPISVAIFAGGLYFSRWCFRFVSENQPLGFSAQTNETWIKISHAVVAIAIAYFIYRLVDIIEFYLKRLTGRTDTKLDDMLVPVIRKTLRIFIAAISALFIADNILEMQLGTVLAAAGVGGLAIALAAQETIANFFGSINIFADRPFQVGDRIRVGGFDGPVEEVGFRSTRIRTLDGHLITAPNSKVVNEMVENISKRPFIKRLTNISVTYDTPPDKVEKALQIIKDILADTEQVNRDPDLVPRVYFSDFQSFYLNILVIYWVKPPDYWLFQEVNEKVNLRIMRAFESEGIEFAFPTQTLYLKKDQ